MIPGIRKVKHLKNNHFSCVLGGLKLSFSSSFLGSSSKLFQAEFLAPCQEYWEVETDSAAAVENQNIANNDQSRPGSAAETRGCMATRASDTLSAKFGAEQEGHSTSRHVVDSSSHVLCLRCCCQRDWQNTCVPGYQPWASWSTNNRFVVQLERPLEAESMKNGFRF